MKLVNFILSLAMAFAAVGCGKEKTSFRSTQSGSDSTEKNEGDAQGEDKGPAPMIGETSEQAPEVRMNVSSVQAIANELQRKQPIGRGLVEANVKTEEATSDSGQEPEAKKPACGVILPGTTLKPGDTVKSCNDQYGLFMQHDGNLVVYRSDSYVMFHTSTGGKNGATTTMQQDGNLVVYGPDGAALWNSGTYGHEGSTLYMQDDGNLVIYGPFNGTAKWNSNAEMAARKAAQDAAAAAAAKPEPIKCTVILKNSNTGRWSSASWACGKGDFYGNPLGFGTQCRDYTAAWAAISNAYDGWGPLLQVTHRASNNCGVGDWGRWVGF